MSMISDSERAAECLDHLQTLLWEAGDHSQDDSVSSLICMLQSPLFRQLLVLQDSLDELSQVAESGQLEGHSIDFLPELQLTPVGHENPVFETEAAVEQRPTYQATPSYNEEFRKAIETAAMGREVETIKLFKPEKQSLGFSVVANPGDTAIYVQDIQPGGIAARHGSLQERDQLLAIDGQPLDVSHQEAIKILQQTAGIVEIVVARGPAPHSPSLRTPPGADLTDTDHTATQPNSLETDMLNTEWTQIEVIDLINDGTGLGFGIIGGRSTGVVVKTILPAGVAHVDGRLHSGDHIIQIGNVDVRGYGSEQVAQVLRQAGSHVRLIVARPINEPSGDLNPEAPIVPTVHLNEHLEQIMDLLAKQDQMIIEKQAEMDQHFLYERQQQRQRDMMLNVDIHVPQYQDELSTPEVVYFDVTLIKDAQHGLGITIAGYIGRDNEPDDLCGIFVKSIGKGSAAEQDGQIQVNDQIIEVNGQALQGFTNHQAVDVLKNTGQKVNLKLARYVHGAKFQKLQEYLAQPQVYTQPASVHPAVNPEVTMETRTLQGQGQQPIVDPEDVDLQQVSDDMEGELTPDIEAAISSCWEPIVGDEFDIVVAQLSKFKESSGLGISLEGTVDVENGVEVRPHHYIRAILPDGPVGVNGRLRSGDELLEVNGKRLLGLNHKEVVGILKQLPQNVRLVCARKKTLLNGNENYAEPESEFQTPSLNSGAPFEVATERLVKSKSDNALSEPAAQSNLAGKKSRSLEPLSGLAMWSKNTMVIELRKGDKGLGFSILDYQDPVNPGETVIVIRSLVPGGVAQLDGRLVPGDRLIFVNEVNLESATLEEAVQTLKGAQKGVVQIGVAKPLPLSGDFQKGQGEEQDDGEEIVADTNISAYATQPMHEPVPHGVTHNYMNLQELEAANSLPILSGLARSQGSFSSQSSESVADDEITDQVHDLLGQGHGRNLSDVDKGQAVKHGRTESKDSFYESDKEELSFSMPPKTVVDSVPRDERPQLKEKPQTKMRPVPLPRRSENHSYENEDAIELLKEHEDSIKVGLMVQESMPMSAAELELSYDDSTLKSMVLKQNFVKAGGDYMDITDSGNTSLAPLPSYEEAVSGDVEFFNMDDLEAPPVPTRDDSHAAMVTKSVSSDSSSSSDEPPVSAVVKPVRKPKTPRPSPRNNTTNKDSPRNSRPRPPIPPKPKSAPVGSPQGKDEPPPLPVSSPPPIAALDKETKTSPGVVSMTTSVESSLPSDQSTVIDQTNALNQSSSSDTFNTSDLKAASASSSSTSRTASPGMSPLSSPGLARSLSGPEAFPISLEKRVLLKRSQNNLGMTVEATDKGFNGCVVKTLTKSGAVFKDGKIKVGDYIMSINNESMRRITNAQARVILRRMSLMNNTDISITYVSAADGAAHLAMVAKRPPESPNSPKMMTSPKSTLSPITKRASSSASDGSNPSSPLASPRKTPMSPTQKTSPIQEDQTPSSESLKTTPTKAKETIVVAGNQTWGPPRLVELYREPGKTLGISIVGGRVDMFHMTEEHMISGIFIKHVLEDSPAGRNGTLKTGDKILKVDGKDLRNATHDQAVETIRNASNPVKFVVQSLTDPACPRDIDSDRKSVQSYDEAAQQLSLQTQAEVTKVVAGVTKVTAEVTKVAPLAEEPPIQTSSPVRQLETGPPPEVPDTASDTRQQLEEDVDEYGYSMERIQRRYGDLNGELHLVDLVRGTSGLGISLAGNKDRNTMSVFVAGIQPDSAADQDGRIIVGDELLEVNGNVLYGRSHLNASAIIKGLTTPVIKIVLLRRDDNLERMAVKPQKLTSPVLKHDQKGEVNQLSSPSSDPATLSPTPSEERPPAPLAVTTPQTQDVIQVISLNKGPSGLGFAIVEESPEGRPGIYVRNITYGGVAERDGRLSVGDQLLEVQDKNLQDVHYDKAIKILRKLQGTVRLKLRKCNNDVTQLAQNNVHGPITLSNPPGESSTDPSTAIQTSEQESHDPLTCPIIPGQETFITIEKGGTGLGLSIVGGSDTLLGAIIIHEVYEEGAAARDGRLWAGDQILEVNVENLREATHDYAIQVLRQTPPTVNMLVFRDDAHVKEEDIYDIFTVELVKKPGKGLGLSIVGKRNDVGVYISDIVKGGAAESDGRLMQGDQILSVNTEDMRSVTQEYAAAVLKTTMGKVSLTVGRLKAGSRTSSRKNSNNAGSSLQKSASSASNKSKGKHSKKGSEDMSHIRVVELEQDAQGSLGLSIAGGMGSSLGDMPIMVANLTPGGPAERSRKLKVGDKILSVNGVSMEKMDHDQVVTLLKSAHGPITLHVTQGEATAVSVSGRSSSTRGSTRGSSSTPKVAPPTTPTPQENNVFTDEEVSDQYKTIVLERGADGLGFSIVGGHGSPHGDLPIYVKNVFTKGAAAENGQLKRGDQILSVNGASLEGLTHEEAVNILKNAKGSVIMNVLS